MAQLRTGKCKQKAYLHRIGTEDSDLCDECVQKETLKHVVLDCRKLIVERKALKAAERGRVRWGDLPCLLGGWSGRKTPAGKWIDGEASRGGRTC